MDDILDLITQSGGGLWLSVPPDYDITDLITQSARVMTPREYANWRRNVPAMPRFSPSGRKITNLSELIAPLNKEQRDDLSKAVRVELEHGMEKQINQGARMYEYIKVEGTPGAGGLAEQSGMAGWSKQFLTPEQVLEKTGSGLQGYLVNSDIDYVERAYTQMVTKPIDELYDYQDKLPAGKGLFPVQTEIRNALAERRSQVSNIVNDQVDAIKKDIKSGELHLSEDNRIVTKSLGDQRKRDLQFAGKYGQANGGIRGITGSYKFVPKGEELPPFAGGQGECCIFNEYGGGGCGPCNRGGGEIGKAYKYQPMPKEDPSMVLKRILEGRAGPEMEPDIMDLIALHNGIYH